MTTCQITLVKYDMSASEKLHFVLDELKAWCDYFSVSNILSALVHCVCRFVFIPTNVKCFARSNCLIQTIYKLLTIFSLIFIIKYHLINVC